MKPATAPSLPRAMPLARAAREILALDTHEVYRLAREGKIPGAFKVGKNWFVSVVTMIRGMQGQKAKTPPASSASASSARSRTTVAPRLECESDEDIFNSL